MELGTKGETNKIKISYIDVASLTSKNFSSKKAWSELLICIQSIYKNFNKSNIDPEELKTLIDEELFNVKFFSKSYFPIISIK